MEEQIKVFTINTKRKATPAVISRRSFQESLKWILIVAQCFGLMPVLGISKPHARFLRFTWKSWRTLYCCLNCIGATFLTFTYIYRALTHGVNLIYFSSLAFHVNTLLVTILFMKLATEWPSLMRKWTTVEFSMRRYGWPPHLHTRIALLTIVIMSMAAVEYTLVKVSEFVLSDKKKKQHQDVFEYYFTVILYPHIFSVIHYSIWKGILLNIINIQLTFAWTFIDVFIMIISTALALRFQQITVRLRLMKNNFKIDNVNVWREIREDYNRLSRLVRYVDNILAYIVLLSFASNLYSILMQLFNSMRPMETTFEKVYFFFSFGFIILRTICVSLYGAWIHDESKEPIGVLNSVPSEIYNVEVKRFIEQVKFDTIALTGKNFFFISRGLILSIAGVIVTYELVLVQFNVGLLQA